MAKFNVAEHMLVPEHVVLSDKEKEELLKKYNITIKELPKFLVDDAGLAGLKTKVGDVIRITRNSPSGETFFYRRVSDA